jgi:hypothetical protein
MWSQSYRRSGGVTVLNVIIHASKFVPPQKFTKVRYTLTKTEYVTKRRIMLDHHNHLLHTYSLFTVTNSNAVELRL